MNGPRLDMPQQAESYLLLLRLFLEDLLRQMER